MVAEEAEETATVAKDTLDELEKKLDEIMLAMQHAVENIPDEARGSGGAPHPEIAENAANLIRRSREFDALCEELAVEWTQDPYELKNELEVLRVAHDATSRDLAKVQHEYDAVLAAITTTMDTIMSRHQEKDWSSLTNRAVRPNIVSLRDKLDDIAQASNWPSLDQQLLPPQSDLSAHFDSALLFTRDRHAA